MGSRFSQGQVTLTVVPNARCLHSSYGDLDFAGTSNDCGKNTVPKKEDNKAGNLPPEDGDSPDSP